MSHAVELCAARIINLNEEGYRADVYDDATGAPIVCRGQPTVGYGCRCRQWSRELAEKVLIAQLEEAEAPLLKLSWYIGCNDARRSALLEIAFNQGDAGLKLGYPHLIAAVTAEDWVTAQAQCTVEQSASKARYVRLGEILLTGQS